MRNGDYRIALAEYNAALDDPDEKVKQIAKNRIQEIELDLTPVLTAAFSRCYHRKACSHFDLSRNTDFKPQYWY